jgi:predicted amidohydrolase YtcJ
VEAEAARLGLTTLHCILSQEGYREELNALAAMASSHVLSLRYRVYVPPEAIEFIDSLGPRLEGERVRINGVKLFTDGSLGARTAALREPYSDEPQTSGILRHTDEELSEMVEKVDARGLQVVIHAIGDRAVEQAIAALSRVTGAKNPRRHRIEHAGLLPRDLRSRVVRYGIRAAVQPMFVTSDTWAIDRLGEERVRDYYPVRSMLADGILTSGGSDSPVESLSPVLGMWAAMTRGGMVPEESISLPQAVALYTSDAASNGFDEASLSEGAPANLTVLDSDVSGMHPALLRKVGVLSTVVEGAAVHSYGSG